MHWTAIVERSFHFKAWLFLLPAFFEDADGVRVHQHILPSRLEKSPMSLNLHRGKGNLLHNGNNEGANSYRNEWQYVKICRNQTHEAVNHENGSCVLTLEIFSADHTNCKKA